MDLIELGTLMTVINLCKEAIRLDRWNKARADANSSNKLNEFERAILHESAQCGKGDGQIQLVKVNSVRLVYSGSRMFDGSPYDQAKYLDAFISLCSRGLVRHSDCVDSDGQPSPLFLITGEAFDLDKDLHS